MTEQATLFAVRAPVRHPARYTETLLPVMARLLAGARCILDPFAGTGRIFDLSPLLPGAVIVGNELEFEWAAWRRGNVVGNALALPFADGTFDAVCVSPCLTPDQRILTADLRWLPCGDIQVGDRLIAFDEYPRGIKPGRHQQPYRRRWRIATVEDSYPAKKECVRVVLENGESVTCTHDHPWLANRYAYTTTAFEWVRAEDLMSLYDPHVLRQLDTWEEDCSYEAGWLAGMFDGEGSLSFGVHGSPKLSLTQVEGELFDLVLTRLTACGYDYNVIARKNTPAGRKPMTNVYITGGFPGILKALGRLRPHRLLGKLDQLEVASRTIRPDRVRVVSVERIGIRDIQGIQTSTGTYIGEGYLMHNTYGNRMADHHDARDASRRNTYRHALARPLHPDNAGALQWGEEYRRLHVDAWTEARRALCPGGRFVLNCKNHYRDGKLVDVTAWHIGCLCALGFTVVAHERIETPGLRAGANRDARVGYESVVLLERGL